jgi:hypothetical protein
MSGSALGHRVDQTRVERFRYREKEKHINNREKENAPLQVFAVAPSQVSRAESSCAVTSWWSPSRASEDFSVTCAFALDYRAAVCQLASPLYEKRKSPMTDNVDPIKLKALELANAHPAGGSHDVVVARAGAYHAYLTGGAATKPATTGAAKPATDKPAKATPAAGTTTAAAKPGAAQPKPTTDKPKPAAAAGAAKPATPGAPANDTKDPNGKNTYEDVVAALQKVMRSVPGDNDKKDKGREKAYAILAEKGNGVKGVRDLKPALYDAVVDACEAAVKKPAATKPATVAVDDFGAEIDTSGASAATAGEDDPPEGGSGDEDL